jgi:hypothetical protein
MRARTAAAILLALSAACTRSAEPLTIPDPSKIELVEVIRLGKNGETLAEHKISERQRIEAIVAGLRPHNTGYREDTELGRLLSGSESGQEYALLFRESINEAAPLIVWIGSDWLGGVDELKDEKGGRAARQRSLSRAEHDDLVALIAEAPDASG